MQTAITLRCRLTCIQGENVMKSDNAKVGGDVDGQGLTRMLV